MFCVAHQFHVNFLRLYFPIVAHYTCCTQQSNDLLSLSLSLSLHTSIKGRRPEKVLNSIMWQAEEDPSFSHHRAELLLLDAASVRFTLATLPLSCLLEETERERGEKNKNNNNK